MKTSKFNPIVWTWLATVAIMAYSNSIYPQESELPTISFNGNDFQISMTDHDLPVMWGSFTSIINANSVDNGMKNTKAIVNQYQNYNNGNYAGNICAQMNAHGFDDWYLPSQNELLQIYKNRATIGNFHSADYWSSTEINNGFDAQIVTFPTGYLMSRSKSKLARVRCIRVLKKDEPIIIPEEISNTKGDDKLSPARSEDANQTQENVSLPAKNKPVKTSLSEDESEEIAEQVSPSQPSVKSDQMQNDALKQNDKSDPITAENIETKSPGEDINEVRIGFQTFFENHKYEFENCELFLEALNQWINILETTVHEATPDNLSAIENLKTYVHEDSPYLLIIELQIESYMDLCPVQLESFLDKAEPKVNRLLDEAHQLMKE